MSDPAILFVKPKAISAKDKKTLAGAGIIVVEVSDVNDVKFVRAHSELDGSDLLLCAAKALTDANYTTDYALTAFGKAVTAAIKARLPDKSAAGVAQ